MVLSVAVSNAKQEDVPELFCLWSNLIRDNTTEPKIREMVDNSRGRRDRVLLFKINGNARGFIAYNVKNEKGHIAGITMDKPYRGFGYGSCLLDIMEEELKNAGFTEVILEVRPSNIPAIRFYTKNGYELCNEEKDFYGQRMHALSYKKRLL